jgi:type VI secretion system protein ImpI
MCVAGVLWCIFRTHVATTTHRPVNVMSQHLILEVEGGPELEIGDPPRKVFGLAGGRIGRALDCDWVLSNPYVSRHHATVSHAAGVFYIESAGTNGVALNDPQDRVPRRARRPLRDGDRVFLDDYEIRVVVTDDAKLAQSEAAATNPPPWNPLALALDPAQEFPLFPDVDRPDKGAGVGATMRPPQGTVAATPAGVPPQSPEATKNTGLKDLPPQPDVDAPDAPLSPTMSLAAAAGLGSDMSAFDIEAFLNGAKLTPGSVSSGNAFLLGQIVHTVVQGLIDVLRARAEFRSQLPVSGHSKGSLPNNPLRLAADADNAVSDLLRSSVEGELPPRQAIEDAFDEMRFHQLAVLAGLHAGFHCVTSRLDPHKLIEQGARSPAVGMARFGLKGRYWDKYVGLFEHVVASAEGGLRRQYVDEFAAAYELQLANLKRNRVRSPD